MKAKQEFFDYARERYAIYLSRKAGRPAPWTEDPVLQEFYFTNVFREDDRVTIWFKEKVRDPLSQALDRHEGTKRRLLIATAAFRWFNRIETAEKIRHLLLGRWDSNLARKQLNGLSPIVTGAYMVNTPPGYGKLDGVLWCIDRFIIEIDTWNMDEFPDNLEDTFESLLTIPRVGRFVGYEIVTDLRHTWLLRDAPDINTWASFGPGAARGLGRIYGEGPDEFSYGSRAHQQTMLELAGCLIASSRLREYWPVNWPRWEMREVEHTLCEYDKYCRAKEGGRLKRRYDATGGR